MPMTLATFDALVDALFDKCKEMYRTKGLDNIKGSSNRFENFERLARRRGASPLFIIATYQDKHRDCIDSYIENGRLGGSESLEMRFVDDIAYGALMLGQAIAEGYTPTEDWLKAALNTERKSVEDKTAKPAAPGDPTPMRTLDFGKTGQACCNPDGDECCDVGEDED